MQLTPYKSQLDQLFAKAQAKNVPFADRGYALPEEIHDDGLLFIGLNPSYVPKKGAMPGNHFYPLPQDAKGYFGKFQPIAQACECKWSHLDLLAVRETKQKNIQKLESSDLWFIWEQLDSITRPILAQVRSKAVIVVNTLARKYLGKEQRHEQNIWLGYQFEQSENNGAYYLKGGPANLNEVPFFFSGMLTGQRALDLGSYERLKWQVAQVVSGKLGR